MNCFNTNSNCAIPGENYLVCHWEPVCHNGKCRSNYDIPFRMFVNGSCEPVKYLNTNSKYYERDYEYGINPIRKDCKLNEYQWKWSKEECYVSCQWLIQNKI